MSTTEKKQPALLIEEFKPEYDSLRQEILHNDTLITQILGGVVVLSSALMSIALSDSVTNLLVKSFLFFFVQAIAYIGLLQTLERERTNFVIASYLRTFIESKIPSIKWETRLEKFRASSRKASRISYYFNFQVYTYPFLIGINYLLAMYFLYEFFTPSSLSITLGIAIFVGILICWLIADAWRLKRINTTHHSLTFDPIWQNIKAGEEQQSFTKRKR